MAISHSTDVVVQGVTLTDSVGWTSTFSNCTNLLVSHVRIYGDWRMPNNDGIDVCACTNTTIEHVDIDTGDDCISPKTNIRGANGTYLPLVGLTVRHSRLRSRSFGVKFGTETHGNMSDIVFDNIQIHNSHQGIGIDWRGAGHLRNASFTNMNILRASWVGSGPYEDQQWMGNAQPIFVSNDVWPQNPDSGNGTLSGLRFENVSATGENGVFVSGRGGRVSDVALVNVNVVVQQRPKNNATNGPHPSHNYHPSNVPQHGKWPPWGPEQVAAPVDAFYVEHASGVRLVGCSAAFAGKPEPGNTFGCCVRLGNGTAPADRQALLLLRGEHEDGGGSLRACLGENRSSGGHGGPWWPCSG
eukprot:g2243.t1